MKFLGWKGFLWGQGQGLTLDSVPLYDKVHMNHFN